MMRAIGSLLGLAATGWLAICGLLYFTQDALLYHPTEAVSRNDAEALLLEHDGQRLKTWRFGAGPHAILYFGGNAENVAHNIPRFNGHFPMHTFYLLNYRGYGGSSGEPDEAAFYRDAEFLFDYAAERHTSVSVIGRSLGSGVATWLAAERPVARLVLVTPYDSIENVASNNYPYVPVSLLLRDKYASVQRADRIRAPVLILVANHDEVIPHASTMALARRFSPDRLRLRTIDNANHNSISRSPAYVAALREFLQPDAPGNADDVMIETKSTLHTGAKQTAQTVAVENQEWI